MTVEVDMSVHDKSTSPPSFFFLISYPLAVMNRQFIRLVNYDSSHHHRIQRCDGCAVKLHWALGALDEGTMWPIAHRAMQSGEEGEPPPPAFALGITASCFLPLPCAV